MDDVLQVTVKLPFPTSQPSFISTQMKSKGDPTMCQKEEKWLYYLLINSIHENIVSGLKKKGKPSIIMLLLDNMETKHRNNFTLQKI